MPTRARRSARRCYSASSGKPRRPSPRSGGAGGQDVWEATRISRAVAFDQLRTVGELNTAMDDSPGSTDASGLHMVFTRDYQLLAASRAGRAASWQVDDGGGTALINNGTIHSPGSLRGDGLTVYFSSDKLPRIKLYEAHRPSLSQPFGPATLVTGEFDENADQYSPWVSADGKRLYFGQGTPVQTYVAERL